MELRFFAPAAFLVNYAEMRRYQRELQFLRLTIQFQNSPGAPVGGLRLTTGGLSISRDGKYALAAMKDHFTIDLMMVDGMDIRPF